MFYQPETAANNNYVRTVLNCPAERQQLNTERSARCPEPPPAAAGSQAQYQLQLKNRYERVSSSSNLKQRIDMRGYLAAAARKKNFCTEIVPDSLSKPSLSIRRPHPYCLIQYQKSVIKCSVMKYLQSSQFLKSLVTTATINDSPIQIIRM